MSTTISLVSIHHHTWLQFFFFVMRTFKIYLATFYTTEMLTIVIRLYITSLGLIYCITVCTFWFASPISYPTPLAYSKHHRLSLLICSPYGVGAIVIPSLLIIHGILKHKEAGELARDHAMLSSGPWIQFGIALLTNTVGFHSLLRIALKVNILVFPLYREGIWSSERLNNLSNNH